MKKASKLIKITNFHKINLILFALSDRLFTYLCHPRIKGLIFSGNSPTVSCTGCDLSSMQIQPIFWKFEKFSLLKEAQVFRRNNLSNFLTYRIFPLSVTGSIDSNLSRAVIGWGVRLRPRVYPSIHLSHDATHSTRKTTKETKTRPVDRKEKNSEIRQNFDQRSVEFEILIHHRIVWK